jgi:hypothetical protein
MLLVLAAFGLWVYGCAETGPSVTSEKNDHPLASPSNRATPVETGKKFKEIVEKGSGGRIGSKFSRGRLRGGDQRLQPGKVRCRRPADARWRFRTAVFFFNARLS